MTTLTEAIRLYGTQRHSFVNGPGIRYVIFTQGCPHHCIGCQNPDSHDPNAGYLMQTEDLLQEILRTQHLDGITISGGEPFMQADACAKIAAECRSRKLTVWVYTGYRYEDIVAGHAGENAKKLLQHIDVLVDGPFELEHRSDSCKWRGSTNQRLIDIPASQANPQNAIVLYEC